MSKRNPATQGVSTRRRGLFPRLRDIRIRSKLALLLVVPVIALVVLAGIRIAGSVNTVISANRLRALTNTAVAGSELVDKLQAERLASANLLTGVSNDNNEYVHAASATDQAYNDFRQRRGEVSAMPDSLQTQLDSVDSDVSALGSLRGKVGAQKQITLSSTLFQYRTVIADLLDYENELVNYASDRTISGHLRSLAAFSQAKEYVAQEQTVIIRALGSSPYTPQQLNSFAAATTGFGSSLLAFDESGPASWTELYGETVTGPDVAEADALETIVSQTDVGKPLDISADRWNSAMSGRLALMRKVETQSLGELGGAISDYRASLVRTLVAESALLLIALILAVAFALAVAQAMARSLRRLREGALQVAYEGLPQAVGQLETVESIGGMTPEEIAGQVRDPIQIRGRDEIGQVSEAFNVVHREAVRVAAAQAVLRASVSTMFINLARRSQLLVDRLIGHLDRLEQGEEDPDRLAQLFQLDHLATRMRRNDENLLVLAGADSTRARREAAPLGDVLRAAQSEVEQYTRIEFGVVDRDVEVEATAVNDVVHLVAELLDNATSFSSPDTAVVVDARRVGDRAIVQIEDRGIGMSGDVLAEVNERLANPPLVDVAVSRMMGLVVVGRLASRLGIKIELRPAPERGTVADVVLPGSVLVPNERPGVRPTELPTQSGPLALETAPGRSGREAPRPSPEPADPMPGIPFQPPARDSLADAANGHRLNNGTSALPRRQPGQQDEPTGLDAAPATGSDEPIRRSLFDPPPRKQAQEQTGSFDAPPEPTSYEQPGGFEQTSQLRPSDPPPFEPRTSQLRPEPTPERPAEPSLYQRLTGAEPAQRGADDAPPASAADDTVTFDRIPSELPRRSLDDSVRRAPQRPAAEPEPPNTADHDPWAEPPARPMADDLTVETPQLPGRDVWSSSSAPAEPAPRADQRRYDGQLEDEAAASRGLDSATPEPEHGSGAGRAEIIPRNVDDTMELPIFREVESAWFRTSPSRPRSEPAAGAPSTQAASASRPAGVTATQPQEAPVRAAEPKKRPTVLPTRVPTGGDSPRIQPSPRPTRRPAEPGPAAPSVRPAAEVPPNRPAAEVPSEGRPDIDPWRSAADKGWQAASAITSPRETDTTSAGLPIRRPMAQLVPGGIEEASRPKSRARERSPEAVRGLLSAYHRGVQRGRAGGGDSPRAGAAPGHRSTGNGAGEEQEA